ncbi:DUF2884 family protein [Thalassotalea psychrophila]|uniref:DUF2884 family protein n=1 Tax=Thalassotalea psychrophila TaxID=3065647 RepID=A0ABY9TWL9_9GAMM|nr:DUF2884 family protein [Colwelliaceae bacterium SQ149]
MKKSLITNLSASLLLSTALLSTATIAHENNHGSDSNYGSYSFNSDECSIDVNYGVAVSEDSIRFINKDETYVQINNNQQLFVEGKLVNLTDRQQALVSEYSEQINQQVPAVVNLATDAIEIAFQAVSHVVIEISGDNEESKARVDNIFTKINAEVEKRFNEKDGNYFIAEQDFDEFDQFMEDELEDEIEELIADSVGDLLIAVGTAMNSEEGNFEQKMEAFGERMENMGRDIEAAVEGKAEGLGEQAEQLCHNLKSLDQLESELSNSIDEMNSFNLITVSD